LCLALCEAVGISEAVGSEAVALAGSEAVALAGSEAVALAGSEAVARPVGAGDSLPIGLRLPFSVSLGVSFGVSHLPYSSHLGSCDAVLNDTPVDVKPIWTPVGMKLRVD
jgi:hypothetical protein